MHLRNPIRRSTGPSVCQSIVLSVTHTEISILTSQSQSRSRIISCNHVTIQSLCHHEDASLALWALFHFFLFFFLFFLLFIYFLSFFSFFFSIFLSPVHDRAWLYDKMGLHVKARKARALRRCQLITDISIKWLCRTKNCWERGATLLWDFS